MPKVSRSSQQTVLHNHPSFENDEKAKRLWALPLPSGWRRVFSNMWDGTIAFLYFYNPAVRSPRARPRYIASSLMHASATSFTRTGASHTCPPHRLGRPDQVRIRYRNGTLSLQGATLLSISFFIVVLFSV
jgi:hypothetical protein